MKYEKLACLVERARRGDEEAFAHIYSEFSKSVYYIALKMTKNEQDANDMVQETMMKLHADLDSIKNPRALIAYVHRIAHHECANFLNKTRTQKLYEIDLETIPENDLNFIPKDFVDDKEKREHIVSLIAELSESNRAVVLLYYYGQYSIKEIAEILGIEEQAVKTRMFRARATLKRKLEDVNRKEAGVYGMLPPALTPILLKDADEVFTPEISAEIWAGIGEKLGYSAATIAKTTTIATSGAKSVTAATAGAATGITSWLATAIVAMPAAAIVCVSLLTQSPQNVQTSLTQTIYDDDIPLFSHQENAVFGESAESQIDLSATGQPASLPSGYSQAAESFNPDGFSPHDSFSGETWVLALPPGTSKTPVITARNRSLTYSAGTLVTPERILEDAGVTATAADGRPLTAVAQHFDNIDFNRPDNYGLYVEATDIKNDISTRIVILVKIVYK